MPDRLTNPTNADLDAMLRRAHARGRLDAVPDDPDDEAPVAPEPVAPGPGPLAGGSYGPTPPAPPSGEAIIRGAIAAARGHHVDWAVRQYLNPAETTSTTFTVPQ